jgi:hypothetical protein
MTRSIGEGARLIALNMTLNGTPREETARYLQENFDLGNADAILDEVYPQGRRLAAPAPSGEPSLPRSPCGDSAVQGLWSFLRAIHEL